MRPQRRSDCRWVRGQGQKCILKKLGLPLGSHLTVRCSKVENGDVRKNPSYLSFFGKTKASKKKKTPPGAANVAAHAHVFFFQLAFVLHEKNLENSDVGASSRRWFLTGG
jgi:hypothetical protein